MNDIQNIDKQQSMGQLYASIKGILATARKRAYSAVNFAMVESYWLIGQQILMLSGSFLAAANSTLKGRWTSIIRPYCL